MTCIHTNSVRELASTQLVSEQPLLGFLSRFSPGRQRAGRRVGVNPTRKSSMDRRVVSRVRCPISLSPPFFSFLFQTQFSLHLCSGGAARNCLCRNWGTATTFRAPTPGFLPIRLSSPLGHGGVTSKTFKGLNVDNKPQGLGRFVSLRFNGKRLIFLRAGQLGSTAFSFFPLVFLAPPSRPLKQIAKPCELPLPCPPVVSKISASLPLPLSFLELWTLWPGQG